MEKACYIITLIVSGMFLSSFPPAANGQNHPETAYQFRHLAIGDGLSHNQVHAIFQDRRGFMWFGTLSGLNRYDGHRLRHFRRELSDTTSLSDDYIMGIFQGPQDKLWIRTQSGMNIYDPVTETFSRSAEDFLLRAGIPGETIAVRKGTSRYYWFLTEAGELYRYDESQQTSRRFMPPGNSGSLRITAFTSTTDNAFWLIYEEGEFQQVSERTLQVLHSSRVPGSQGKPREYNLYADRDGDLWIYNSDAPQGVFFYQPENGKGIRMHRNAGPGIPKLSNDLVNQVIQDHRGRIWLCTDHGGVTLLDKETLKVTYLLNREGDGRSLAQNSINTAYKDSNGVVWLGTFKKGISYYHDQMIRFPVYKHLPGEAGSLPYNDVNCFEEDAAGNLWIGTNGGGLIYFDRKRGTFTRYRHKPSEPGSLSNDVIVSLCLDREGKLWIGTYHGGLNCFDGKKFVHYPSGKDVPGMLGDDNIWEIFEDSRGRLWIGTISAGLYLFDRETGTFRNFSPRIPGTVHSWYVSSLMEDRDGNLWIGTTEGIDVLKSTDGEFVHYGHSARPGSLSNNHVISLKQDREGRIWAGTRDGLNLFDKSRRRFTTFRISDGLPHNVILTILEDASGSLWVSTPNGISRIALSEGQGRQAVRTFRNYDELDGLQGREFNENAAYRTSKGELIFGGAGGFNLFRPDAIKTNPHAPDVVITGFNLFNKPASLPRALPETREITLKHNQDVFSIEFAALNFINPEKNSYAYKLEGFNEDWMVTGDNRIATYTNLDPGEYVFRVRASNDQGTWSGRDTSLVIRIRPPFWKTPLAYLLYVALATGALYGIRQLEMKRMRARYALEEERSQARRMHELDMMKIRFFTNVSHEFRTPLSLILSPIDQLLKQAGDPALRERLGMIGRNARRLMNLVNQLLDFRKMEIQESQLQPGEGDIVQCLREHFSSFSDLAEKKQVHYSFKTDTDYCRVLFDHDKLERILFNLLSNAFKFTPDGGRISLELSTRQERKSRDISVEIKVRDSGIGIPPDRQKKIFQRFFQLEVPGSMINHGSGIGLAITREFVTLHRGTIQVESEEGQGSCFSVCLPLKSPPLHQESSRAAADQAGLRRELQADQPGVRPESPAASAPDVRTQTATPAIALPGTRPAVRANARTGVRAGVPAVTAPDRQAKFPTLLLVEDYEDFRFYLKDNLKQYFHIVEASEGQGGWAKALSLHPDLIVSDVNMPGMNGIDLCLKIKGDPRTAHIPVILLTALAGEHLHIRGLETGAADYITKPFNFEILLSKIRNILEQKQAMEKTLRKQVEIIPGAQEIESADEKFARKALQVVETHILNPDFSVDLFSREMHMSRVALYKKLRILTGKTPSEFIRSIRLKKAAGLLEKSQLNVSEIAYEVGFSDPKHFSRHFKSEFGIIPSKYSKTVLGGSLGRD